MRSTILLLGALAFTACDDDDGARAEPNLDGGQHDAGNDAKVPDAGDSGLDCSPLDQPYKFYSDGGLSPLRDVYTVSGSNSLKVDRVPGGAYMDAGTYSCSASFGACGTAALDSAEISGALRGVAALWGDGATVYGKDDRPSDGAVLVVERSSDGKKIVIGTPCGSSSGCTAIPASVAQLATIYQRIIAVPLGKQEDGGLAGSCSP